MDFLKGKYGTCISLLEVSEEYKLCVTERVGSRSVRVLVWSRCVEVGSIGLSCLDWLLGKGPSWSGKGSWLWSCGVGGWDNIWSRGGNDITSADILKGKIVL